MCRGTLGLARPIAEWTPELVMAAAIGDVPVTEPPDGGAATGASS
jgi:hypothetical protein